MCQFSIIMPVYNAEQTLRKSVNSVLTQTINNFELIVVDDGSIDNSIEILKRISESDTRVIVIRQENSGPGAARNNAIMNSKGKYIAFLDADDYWEPDFLESVLEVSKRETADLIFIDTVKEREDGKRIKDLKVYLNKNLSRFEMLCYQITGKIPWGMSKVIRRDLLNRTKGEFLNINVGEETIFSFEVLKNAQKVTFVEKPIYHYVQNSTGQHTKGNYNPWGPMIRNLKTYLMEQGDYDRFESTINSLALKGLCIVIYRLSCEFNIREAIKKIKKSEQEYRKIYDFFNINYEVLDKSTITILRLLNCRLYFVLFYGSRYRKRRQNK